MKTIGQIRRERLAQLQAEQRLTFAEMNVRLGRSRRDGTFSQIANQAPNSKSGKPRQMGDDQARDLEKEFKLPVGWFDTDPIIEVITDELIRLRTYIEKNQATNQWPINSVVPDRFFKLPTEERARIDSVVRTLVELYESTLITGADHSTSE